MNIKLQKMTAQDLENIVELGTATEELQITKEKPMYYSVEQLKSLMDKGFLLCVCAFVDDEFAGYHLGIIHREIGECYFSDIAVKPKFRGNKIGSVLFDELVRLAQEQNLNWQWALVEEENSRMQKFIESRGFKKGNKFYFYYKDN